MAKIFPDSTLTRVIFTSSAEEQLYETCRNQLGPQWHVYYSCNLSTQDGEDGMRDNEIDFVIYHPKYGVIVIEVKGGRISYDNQTGKFYSINRHDEKFLIKDPFKQALVWKSRFLRYLRVTGVKVPVCHAVCLPSVSEEEIPRMASIEPAILIGRNRILHLEETLKSIAKVSHPERFLEFTDVKQALDDILTGKAFTSKLYLRDYIDSHDVRVKDVEDLSETFLTPIAGSQRLGIEGEAGTGKTILALLLAKKVRDEGKRVAVMSSNILLNLYLKREAGDGVDVWTYMELSQSLGIDLLSPPVGSTASKEDWLQFVGPEQLKAAIASSVLRYDVLICDEAQDVQPFWWEALEEILSGPDARLYLFFDRSQGVFGSGGNERHFVPEDVLPVPQPYFPLVHNYRNTREIAGFARYFRTGRSILQSHCGRFGYVPEILVYKDTEDCQRILGRLFRKLIREEGIDSSELTLLSAREPGAKDSVLYQCDEIAKTPLHRLTHNKKTNWRDAVSPRGTVAVSTIIGFKGLETPVGILLNLSEYNLPLDHPIMSSLVYVACSRAKHMLYILVQERDPKRDVLQKALSSIDSTGTMVLEGSGADYEFVGTVAHYNPDRIGWLKVNDPGFQRNSIMFFPSDVVKSGIVDIKVGKKLRFRPRVEGLATIACDLKISKVS
jgi:hypothetical protein